METVTFWAWADKHADGAVFLGSLALVAATVVAMFLTHSLFETIQLAVRERETRLKELARQAESVPSETEDESVPPDDDEDELEEEELPPPVTTETARAPEPNHTPEMRIVRDRFDRI